MLRNLLCESNIHLATQLDGLWVAPLPAPKYFADNLDTYDGLYEAKLDAINRTYALSLFPRRRETVRLTRPYRAAAGGWRRPGTGR